MTSRALVDALWPWVVCLIALAVGIYFTFWAGAIQRDLIPKARERSVTESGERYVKSRAYRVVTRIIGVVSLVAGLAGIGYIVTTDPSGNQQYYRGGPANEDSAATAASTLSRLAGRKDKVASGSPSPWGSISARYGEYREGTVDWERGTPPTITFVDDDQPCNRHDQVLEQAMVEIRRAAIPYYPWGPNSNSVARTGIERLGLQPGMTPVWAPGWNTSLK